MKKGVDKVIVFVSVMFILVAIVALFEIVCIASKSVERYI